MRKISCALLAATGLVVCSESAQAEEPFFLGDTWGVWFNVPEEGDDPEVHPNCILSTRVWASKSLTFLYDLTSATYIEPWLQIGKEDWDLPLGKKTKVQLITIGGVIEYELSAGSTTTLTGSIDKKIVGDQNYMALGTVLGLMLDARRTGITMKVRFAGNEPEWSIPAMDQLETYQVKQAFNRCISTLRSMGSDYYAADGERQTEPTSPFAD